MQINEIKTSEEISKTLAVLTQIYENLNHETYVKDILSMMESGYKMAAVFEDKEVENGRYVGVIGVRVTQKLQHGKIIEIEDFAIDKDKCGIGVGKILIKWAEWQAASFGCKNIVGGIETKRLDSQRIYSREGFILDGFWFRKTC